MDFRRQKKARVQIDNPLSFKYPHDLQMYNNHPDAQITFSEFKELAVERLEVLRILELVSLKGIKNFEKWRQAVLEELNRQGLKLYRKLFTSSGIDATDEKACQERYEARQRDHISHFILCFVYCQSEEYRRWFINRELELFRLRWSYLSAQGKKLFLKLNEFNYAPLDNKTVHELGLSNIGTEYYCVKWTDVLDLVRNRKVHLDRGKAFITASDLISVLGAMFRSKLSHSLVIMSHRLPEIQKDERLKQLIKNLHHTYTGKSYTANEGNRSITLQSLDMLSKTSFPLCMRQMYTALKTHHHLKHWARQQFGLFLKGVGLSLEDALTFWRTEFTKKPDIDLDSFEKKYAYNVRYNYGKEGKRTNYTPYSCAKVIASAPGSGEYHGCPFKYNGVTNLKQTLTAQKISEVEISEILSFVNMNQYQLACAKYFEVTHRAPLLSGVTHPNQYFEESQKFLGGGKSETQVTKRASNASTSKPTTSQQATESDQDFINESEFDMADLEELPC